MNAKRVMVLGLFGAILAMALFGCATSDQKYAWSQHESQRPDLNTYAYMPYAGEEAIPAPPAEPVIVERIVDRAELLPANANAGECYARVFAPPRYQTSTVRVLSRQASQRVETIPATYEVVEEKILVRQASKRFEEVPAEYGWVEEMVLVEGAKTVWKEGRGIIEQVDNTTGEIMCLVEVPASYQTVRRQVVTKPATIREIEIPAEYETVRMTKMVSPSQEKYIPIPEEYTTVTRTEKVSDGSMQWKRVLCETNMTPEMVSRIQDALMKAGHYPGAIDGIIGPQTHMAIKSYQKQNGLAEGDLTYETIESLGVKIN